MDGHPRFYYYFKGHHIADYAGKRSEDAFFTFVTSLAEALESDLLPPDAFDRGMESFATADNVKAMVSESQSSHAARGDLAEDENDRDDEKPTSVSDDNFINEISDPQDTDVDEEADENLGSMEHGDQERVPDEDIHKTIVTGDATEEPTRVHDDESEAGAPESLVPEAGDSEFGVAWLESDDVIKHLDDTNFRYLVMGREAHILVLFFTPECEACQTAGRIFTEAAALMKQDEWVRFTTLNCEDYQRKYSRSNVTWANI